MADAQECPICYCEVAKACRTPCGHVFCADCFTASLPPETPSSGKCPICRRLVSLYNTVTVEDGSPLRSPPISTIFGQTYLQGGKVGVASYHFVSPNDCYISYEHCPATWKHDDGSPLPQRKEFTSCSFDTETRTFRGTVEWAGDASRTINGGDARWVYEMTFSESLNIICDGTSTRLDVDGHERGKDSFPSDLVYWRALSADATTLAGTAFIQGGRLGLASYHFEAPGVAYISYAHAPEQWLLDDGTRPPAKKPFLSPSYDPETRTFTGVIEWPVAFGGDGRWEYEMRFGEGLECISGGEVRAFKPDGSPTRRMTFAGPNQSLVARLLTRPSLVYERYDEHQMEMIALLTARKQEQQHR